MIRFLIQFLGNIKPELWNKAFKGTKYLLFFCFYFANVTPGQKLHASVT